MPKNFESGNMWIKTRIARELSQAITRIMLVDHTIFVIRARWLENEYR